jgi:hypothetical protein
MSTIEKIREALDRHRETSLEPWSAFDARQAKLLVTLQCQFTPLVVTPAISPSPTHCSLLNRPGRALNPLILNPVFPPMKVS